MPKSDNRRKTCRGQKRRENAERNWRLGRPTGAVRTPAPNSPISMDELRRFFGLQATE